MSVFDNLTIIDRLNITLSNLNMTHLIGKIKIYAGTTLPAGYVWCDGNNGTPDLTGNQYIISDLSGGTQQQTGNNYFTNNMISHTHTVTNSSSAPGFQNPGSNSKIFNSAVATFNPFTQYINTINPASPDLNVYFQRILSVGNPTNTGGNDQIKTKSKNRGGVIVGKDHNHGLWGSQPASANTSVQFNFNINTDFKTIAKNVTTGSIGNAATYEPPYAHIGFIMKDPNTWL